MRGVGLLETLDVGLDSMQLVESGWKVHPDAGGLRLIVGCAVFGEFIDHRSVEDEVQVTC